MPPGRWPCAGRGRCRPARLPGPASRSRRRGRHRGHGGCPARRRRGGRPEAGASYCCRKCSRRVHRLSARSAALVRASVGQPPRRSTRAIRRRSRSRVSHGRSPRSVAAKRPSAWATKSPLMPASSTHVGGQGDAGVVLLDGRRRPTQARAPSRAGRTRRRRPRAASTRSVCGSLELGRVSGLGRAKRLTASGCPPRSVRQTPTVDGPVPPGTESQPGSGSQVWGHLSGGMSAHANRCRAPGSATTQRAVSDGGQQAEADTPFQARGRHASDTRRRSLTFAPPGRYVAVERVTRPPT